MSNAVCQLVCPNCAASVANLSETGPQRCPQCGYLLEEAGVAHPAGAAARPAVSSVPEGTVAAEEEALIADLREALGFDAGARRPGETRLPPGSAAAQLAPPREPLPSGTRLGDFELLGELGRGGMGVVYRARQVSLGREIALKVLPAYARHGRLAVQRFRAEAQAAGRLHHTNIVAIHAQGEDQGHYFYAMELIDGVGLDTVIHARPDLLSSTRAHSDSSAARLRSGPALRPPPPPSAPPPDLAPPAWTRDDFRHIARLVADVADALDYAHQAGVIHRDVKPHNLLLGHDNRLHLTDFGLARLTDAPHLTVSGEVLGTPAYLSPEQIRGDLAGVDERTDIYSLGVTLYEIVTRQKPYDGQTRDQIMARICTGEPLAPRRIDPRIPVDLETICLRAIEKDARRRHPSAAVLAEDLRRFAEGRPILSKRVTRAERMVKWVRRHKALTTACAAVLAVAVLSGTLLFMQRGTRQRAAAALLHDAYEQLAFFDYRTPGLEQSHVAPAERHGADAADVALVRALAGIGEQGWAPGVPLLRQHVERRPDDPRGLYLLAWFEHESSDRVAAAETFARAERVRTEGATLTPDAWFFRGLALHFERPDEAIASYRQAIAQRAAAHGFYPLAALHLARARNQQLYQTRRLEHFSEADTRLGELIEHGYYGTYPYYLRSIAHRLAAEIYSGSTGTRDDSLVNEHYEQSLHWARAGQAVDPADDRPVTAEAECLESLGRFAEAIDLRTRARELARTDVKRCEQLHYRWRLYFWTGDLNAARADVAAHAACLPENWDYAYLFPALLLDEYGDHAAARARIVALVDDHPRNARAVIWAATGLRLIGEPAAAQELLDTRVGIVDFAADLLPPQTEAWLRALYDFARGDGLLAELEAHAQQAPTPWKLWGEANFHAAAHALAAGDHATVQAHLQRAYRSFDGEMGATFFARLLLVKMAENPSWPQGGAVSWTAVPDGWHGRAAGLGVSPAAERKNP